MKVSEGFKPHVPENKITKESEKEIFKAEKRDVNPGRE